jgi:hypothetical protein
VALNYSLGTLVEARIRQYVAAGQPAYSTPQNWQVIPNGQPYTIGFSTDYATIAAGGPTFLVPYDQIGCEYRLVLDLINVIIFFMKGTCRLFLFFALLFFIFAVRGWYHYVIYSDAIKKSRPIAYQFSGKEKRGGRGSYYVINVFYENDTYTVRVTSKEYYNIDDGVFPELYYSKKNGSVFSELDKTSSFRVFIMFSVGCVGAVVGLMIYKRKGNVPKG